MQLKTLLILVLVLVVTAGAVAYLVLQQLRALKEVELQREAARKEKLLAEEKRTQKRLMSLKQQPEQLARQALDEGKRLERGDQWSRARKMYEKSLKYHELDEIKRLLRGARLVEQADALCKEKKWEEALKAYESALPDVTNTASVEKRIKNAKDMMAYYSLHKKADDALAKRQLDEAEKLYREAQALAKGCGIPTDIPLRMREIRLYRTKAARRAEDMKWFFRLCGDKKKPFAMLAGCRYYAAQPDMTPYKDEIVVMEQTARNMLKQTATNAPSKSEPKEVDVLIMKDGTTVEGKIVGEISGGVRIEVTQGERKITRVLPNKMITKRTKKSYKPEEWSTKSAKQLLERAVRYFAENHVLDGLECLGRLQEELGDAGLLKDPVEQKSVIASASFKVLNDLGDSVEKLTASAVETCSTMCETCEGAGKMVCKYCGGTGKIRTPCPICQGKKRVVCDQCMGAKRIGGERCTGCGGKGYISCQACYGRGYIERPCEHCDPVTHMMLCPTCRGTGKRPRR